MKNLLSSIRSWIRRLSRPRYEVPNGDTCRRRIFDYCDEIYRCRKLTADTWAKGNYRDSAIQSMGWAARNLLKELGR